ncbi:hypothetical protein NQ317_004295 [Molorchus minor]|uniref:Peptidase S1 domain-containing protein n=1 Tax=Molorchus minor TaxID=1323400 RepID=A0ABQ9JEW5_9CUCU|nr:hypothetical protein NQ317_004295 [Molorchus minor]
MEICIRKFANSSNNVIEAEEVTTSKSLVEDDITLPFELDIEIPIPPEAENSDFDGKIIGGADVPIDRFPYQLSLEYKGIHSCGATLIAPKWAVTAAHCTDKLSARYLTVRAGSSNNQRGGQVVESSRHPIVTQNAKPILLAEENSPVDEGTVGTVSGWGFTRENGAISKGLRAVRIPVISQARCRLAYGSQITDRMFCASLRTGGKDACQGDSGGPFVVDGVLTGVISWGVGCARPGYPGVYASVPVLRSFIKSVQAYTVFVVSCHVTYWNVI